MRKRFFGKKRPRRGDGRAKQPRRTNDDLGRAAAVLNDGRKVVILVGAGALGATDEVIETAEVLGAGLAKALLGRAAVPDDLPFVTGQMGLLGTKPSWQMMNECDTLLMIGSAFPNAEFLPKEGQARGVQIDIDPKMQSIRYPMEVNLTGDAATTLRALLPLLQPKRSDAWRRRIERRVADWWKGVETRAHQAASPINPERLFWELSLRLPDNAIVSADSGTSANWFARDAVVDPNVPTLPPHITASQAKSYAKALLKGDPKAGAIAWHTISVGRSAASAASTPVPADRGAPHGFP